jgi:hypothetical protein
MFPKKGTYAQEKVAEDWWQALNMHEQERGIRLGHSLIFFQNWLIGKT